MNDIIFLYLYDSSTSVDTVNSVPNVKGLSCIDLNQKVYLIEELRIKGIHIPKLIIYHTGKIYVYSCNSYNLDLVKNMLFKLFV